MKTKKLKKKIRKLIRTLKTIKSFIKQTKNNYIKMKQKIKSIYAIIGLAIISTCLCCSCNVTRKVTTESSYFQKGDTTCTIVTKTTESYDATKKGVMQ